MKLNKISPLNLVLLVSVSNLTAILGFTAVTSKLTVRVD